MFGGLAVTEEKAGYGPTFTVAEAVVEQPLEPSPVTEYVVVEAGLAFTLAPVEAERPKVGDQAYELAPDAESASGVPPGKQITPEPGVTNTFG